MENHLDWDGDQIWYSKTKVANVHTNDYKSAFRDDFYKFAESLLPQAEAYAALCPDQEPNESTLVYSEDPPLKQFSGGIDAQDIVCNGGLNLVFKSTNFQPACVKSSSVQKLMERGWASK